MYALEKSRHISPNITVSESLLRASGPAGHCRILYVIGQLDPGGAELQLCYLLRTMDRERYNPAVAVWHYREDDLNAPLFQSLGIPVYTFPGLHSSATKLMALRRLVKEVKPEIVHSYSFFTNFAAWYSTFGSGTISIGSIRQDFLNEYRSAGRIVGRLSARWPGSQICNSLAALKTVEDTSQLFKPTQLQVVSNRLDIDRVKPHPLPQGRPNLLAMGRLEPEKRWDRLLRCVALAASKGADFSVRLAGDGSLMEKLKDDAKTLRVDNRVKFLGLQRDIPSLLRDSTFLVHTADAEGCPNAVMEAMASGRAVVATDAGDVPYIVEDGVTGFVVRRGDDATLVERMVKLITERDLRRRMGEAGRAKAEREFCLGRLVEETLAAYRSAGWKDACQA